jgi:hypothetical protein
MNRSRIKWICGAIAAFLAVAASADPPMYKFNNRTIGNSVAADGCHDFDGGYRCRGVHVWENYDVKGTFESVEVHYYNERHFWDPNDSSYDHRSRFIVCPVDEKSIDAHPKRVTIDFVLDPNDPGCYQDGYHYGWNPTDGYYSEPFGFTGIWAIQGEWLDPFSYGSSMWNGKYKDYHYDGWSGTDWKAHGVHHCKSSWGDIMMSGGWSVTTESGRTFFYEFQGPNGPMWSFYNHSSCNDKDQQK